MFQNAAVDVAVSLILMYLMLSLLCTVINEFIATKLRLRAKSLASALEQLLDNPTLRGTFYRHGLIVTNKRATAIGPQSTVGGVASVASATASAATSGASAVASGVKKMMGGAPAAPPAPPMAPPGVPAPPPAAAPAPVASAPAPAPHDDHPSYLSGRSVALALIGSLDPAKPLPGMPDIQNAVQALPASHIRDALLASLTEAGNDVDKLRTSIATWFDDSMERLSGAYKRQLKWISMLIGLIVAIAFNADSFKVATTLWNDKDRRASVVAIATKMAEEPAPKAAGAVDEDKLKMAIKKTETTLGSLPIGWDCATKRATPAPPATQVQGSLGYYWECAKSNLSSAGLRTVLGWMLTAAALTLGAPFWFDLLQKFVNIRGAGAKPKREDEKAAA